MFMFNTSSSNFEEENPHQKATNNLIAKEISKENVAHAAENKILKEQNKIDELARNEYEKQISDLHSAKEKIVEAEKLNRQVEYREFLLQQIEDKKRSKEVATSPEVRGNAYTYSEDLMTPDVKKNAKHTKQQEMKEALDECIRMKNALKLGEKQMELEEDRARQDFVEKREMGEQLAREQVKQQFETKEQRRDEVAMQWKANQNDDREQFIDSLLRKDTTLSDLSEDASDYGMKLADVEEEMVKNEIEINDVAGADLGENKEEENEVNQKLENTRADEVGHHRYF